MIPGCEKGGLTKISLIAWVRSSAKKPLNQYIRDTRGETRT